MSEKSKRTSSVGHKIMTIVGIVLCVILIPILVINCTLLVKGVTNKDEVPSIGGVFPMIVLTDSMKGVFDKGDLIFCKQVDVEDIKVKDVITFYDPAGNGTSVVTHRVIEIVEEDGKLAFRTKGDYNNTADKDPVPADKIIGMYADFHIAGAGHVALFMQSTPGLIVCVVLPLALLIGYDALRRKLYNKKHDTDREKLMKELEELRKLKEAPAAEEAPAPEVSAPEAAAEEAPVPSEPAEAKEEAAEAKEEAPEVKEETTAE